jgi:putative redox protein
MARATRNSLSKGGVAVNHAVENNPLPASSGSEIAADVLVRGDGTGFAQEIVAGRHRLIADEPAAAGGTDTGPTPYDYLLAALGS